MEESLKRLKRAKTSSAQLDGKGVADDEKTKVITDDDKIRIQLNLDVKELCNQVKCIIMVASCIVYINPMCSIN